METLGGLLALLCVALAGAQTLNLRERLEDCPVDLFFVLDTSESVALRQKPPNYYIDQIKRFTNDFIDELKEMRHRCDRTLRWNSGALHYSDEVKLIRGLSDLRTEREALKADIRGIDYIGKGTYTDCAIKMGLGQVIIRGSHYHENKYIVVVTDGHPLTGYKEPCGGVQEAVNEAKQYGVKVFSVAISPDQEETRLSLIATNPKYRQNFTAADDTRTSKIQTIRTIINLIVRVLLSSLQHEQNSTRVLLTNSVLFAFSDQRDQGYGERFLNGNTICDFFFRFQGLQGDPGPKGDAGPYGLKGGKGDPGKDGGPGRPGNNGQPGPEVDPWAGPGTTATKESAGPPGDDGSNGETGEVGEKGEQGSSGNRGPRGDPCRCAAMDLTFIVDSSESIGAANFALAKEFIITVVDRLTKDQQLKFATNDSRLSVVQYSGSAAQEAVKISAAGLIDFKERVRGLNWLAEATYTGEALDFSLTRTINEMDHANKVVIVLTDGRSDILRDKVPLNVLCGKGLRVGGVGVKDYAGTEPNREQIGELICQSDPKPGFYFVRENFAELLEDAFLQNLTAKICLDKNCPDYKCPISFSQSSDIMVMMDSSASVGKNNFEITKTFVSRLAERFLTAEKASGVAVQMGVGQYSQSARMEQGLTSDLVLLSSQTQQAAFQNDGTDVLEAMDFAMKGFGQQAQRGDSGRHRKALVLFSDGRSQGLTMSSLVSRVRQVASAKVDVFVIAVGSQVNEANLLALVSRGRPDDTIYAQRHLFRVPDYNSLLRGVFHKIVSRRVSLP
uniref:VWFA domain-containing protein n=1 Tax=Gasterosteus aculeatus aculeatus TaxID=481459 RepID=A0AAQ4PXH7_GASAC